MTMPDLVAATAADRAAPPQEGYLWLFFFLTSPPSPPPPADRILSPHSFPSCAVPRRALRMCVFSQLAFSFPGVWHPFRLLSSKIFKTMPLLSSPLVLPNSKLPCHVHRDFFMTKLVQLKRYALTPVVDLINHQSGVDSDVSYNYFYGYFAVTTQVGPCFGLRVKVEEGWFWGWGDSCRWIVGLSWFVPAVHTEHFVFHRCWRCWRWVVPDADGC